MTWPVRDLFACVRHHFHSFVSDFCFPSRNSSHSGCLTAAAGSLVLRVAQDSRSTRVNTIDTMGMTGYDYSQHSTVSVFTLAAR